LLSIAAFFTAFYMGRQIWMVFFGEARTKPRRMPRKAPIITVPLMVLAALSLLGGALNLPFEGFHTLGHWLEYTLTKWNRCRSIWGGGHFHRPGPGGDPRLLVHLRAQPAQAGQPDPLKKPLGFLFTGMENKWFVDEGYWAVIINPLRGCPSSWRM
jgi:NADH-quinone oxidoreductase subunit L